MSAEDNKALVRRFVDEVQSQGNTDLIDEICSPEFVNHSTPPGLPPDREGIKIVTRKTFHGTHEGEFMSIPPSGKTVTMGLIDVVRISEGQVVEHWSIGDNLGMMQQLGIVPRQRENAEPSS